MSKKPQTLAVYFKSLLLENIRCFSTPQTLDFCNTKGHPSQWTLILGNNGVGKTTLLLSLAWMIPVPAVELPKSVKKNIKKSKKSLTTSSSKSVDDELAEDEIIGITPSLSEAVNADFESLLRDQPNGSSTIRAEFTQNVLLDKLTPTSKTNDLFTTSNFGGDASGELTYEKSTGTAGKHEPPLVVLYSANRRQSSSYLDKNFDSYMPKSITGFTGLVNVEELLLAMDYGVGKNLKKKREKERLSNIKQLLADILPDLSGKDPIQIYGPKFPGMSGHSGVCCRTPYGEVQISAMSLGYRTTMGLIVDLAWRLYSKYPNASKPLLCPAIVLIDEIDLHLHPKWQREIVSDLSTHFPNVQFIATAHSPLMVQAADNANLIVLVREEDHIRIENDPEFLKSWRVDQILTSDLFGLSSSRSPEIEGKISERIELIKKSKRTTLEQKRLAKLDQEILSLPTEDIVHNLEIMDFLKKTAP